MGITQKMVMSLLAQISGPGITLIIVFSVGCYSACWICPAVCLKPLSHVVAVIGQ